MGTGPANNETAPKVVSFKPPARRRLHEDVADQLRDAIFDGRFVAGEKLPPERELAEEFQVNRTSVREAIKVLEGLGLVAVRQGDGVTVRPRTEASFDALPSMIFHGDHIHLSLLTELVEVMSPLLLEMGRLAIERHTPEQLDELRRLRDQLAGDPADRHEVLREIVVLLSDMTRNTVWQMLARRMRSFLEAPPMAGARRRYGRDPARLLPTIDACLKAIETGDRGTAVRELQGIIRQIYEAVLHDAHNAENGGISR
ncbi:MAG: FadR/GntR family transcriptional regulator [Candidatus Binatia bacterium]|nr:FadR/GntR family transcriptional regulator [Candidatus Binatia bacterium]